MQASATNHRSEEPVAPDETRSEDEQPEPAWLHPDDDEMPPSALQEIYKNLPPDVTRLCEGARRAMRNAFVESLCKVRDALAPHAKFKE